MAISAGPTLARILAYNAGVGGSNPSPPTRKPSSGGLLLRGLGWTQIACSILQQDLARDQARCGEIMRASGASNFLHHRSDMLGRRATVRSARRDLSLALL